MDQYENDAGYIYYFNKTTGITQKEDPNLIKILVEIKLRFQTIKYSLYRSAQKLFALQNALLSKLYYLLLIHIYVDTYLDIHILKF